MNRVRDGCAAGGDLWHDPMAPDGATHSGGSDMRPPMRMMAESLLVALVALPVSTIAQEQPEPAAAPQDTVTLPEPPPVAAPHGAVTLPEPAPVRPPLGPGQGGLEAVVHRDAMFNGPFLSVRGPQPNLNLGWDARSIRVRSGEWQICTGRNFTGRCTTVDRDQPMLQPQFRSILSMRPTGGWGTGIGESLRGSAAEFFPAPLRNGQRIPCGAGANCARAPANEFCRRVGWLLSRSQAVETVHGRRYVADVLCARSVL